MVELIAVLIIIGVLGAIGTASWFDRKAFDADAFTQQARSMLRYGQKVAIAQNRNVFVRLDGASVALCFDSLCGNNQRMIPPTGTNSGSVATLKHCGNAGNWYCEAPPAGVSYTAGAGNFYFDAQGKPYANLDAPGSTVSTFARLAIGITGDGLARTITVEPETGYVH